MPGQDEAYKMIGRSSYRAWADFLFYRLPILTGICTLNRGPTSLKSLMFVLMWRSSRYIDTMKKRGNNTFVSFLSRHL